MVVGAKVCELTGGFLWFVCGLYVGILTSSLIFNNLKILYFKTEIKKMFSLCPPCDSILYYSDPESMGRVVTPGGDLLGDLLTLCAGTLSSIAFIILYESGN